MHISHVVIKNFRVLEDVYFDLGSRVNVIVGPNAIGKTTILQAIRLAKAIVSPRIPNEAFQALVSLGAASPHFPQRTYLGALAVVIEDIATKRKYEIDSLSSGEKNLVLTFLLIGRSIAPEGIALFDEPELHLNPSVCKDLLQFMLETYSIPRNILFIVCTHSPEILSGAFANETCTLLHVVSGTNVARVGRRALDEYSNALGRLGATVSETLLYSGTVFVEGEDDVAFFEVGFSDLLKRFKIKDRGGRREIEKVAHELQRLEGRGDRVDPILIVFDKDDAPTGLESSNAVRILQWPKRCLENYLIDLDVIVELLKLEDVARTPMSNQGEVAHLFRGLALSQLDEVVARAAYNALGYQNPSLRAEDVEGRALDSIAEALFDRADHARRSLTIEDRAAWLESFLSACRRKRGELEPMWESQWRDLCDGKRLFRDFQKTSLLRIPSANFKRRIVRRMSEVKSENWRLVESLLKERLDLSNDSRSSLSPS